MSDENEIREWISDITGHDIPTEPLSEVLKNGIVLCEVINTILSADKSIQLREPSKSGQGFLQMENIGYFIQKAGVCGVPASENFQTVDLFEGKNMRQVLTCISSLSRNLYKNGRKDLKVIGPKLVEKQQIQFTESQLDEAKRTISGQYGPMKSNKQ